MRQKKSASILKKFLLFNLSVFSILGLFTIIYLKAIQPNLVKKRTADHYIIINNTVDHLQRLNINFNTKDKYSFTLASNSIANELPSLKLSKLKKNFIANGIMK